MGNEPEDRAAPQAAADSNPLLAEEVALLRNQAKKQDEGLALLRKQVNLLRKQNRHFWTIVVAGSLSHRTMPDLLAAPFITWIVIPGWFCLQRAGYGMFMG